MTQYKNDVAKQKAKLKAEEDNNKGYVKENVMVVSALANRIKNSATYQQILTVGWFYKKLYRQKLRSVLKTRINNLKNTKEKKNDSALR